MAAFVPLLLYAYFIQLFYDNSIILDGRLISIETQLVKWSFESAAALLCILSASSLQVIYLALFA